MSPLARRRLLRRAGQRLLRLTIAGGKVIGWLLAAAVALHELNVL